MSSFDIMMEVLKEEVVKDDEKVEEKVRDMSPDEFAEWINKENK